MRNGFIPIMLPSNEHVEELPQRRDAFPYGGLFQGVILRDCLEVYMESWPLSQALSLFSVPDRWLPHFAFSKKVCASAFGGTKGVLVRPAWRVLPCGWKNSLNLAEEALRHLVFGKCGVPRPRPTGGRLPRQQDEPLAVECVDPVEEMSCLRKFGKELEAGEVSELHRRFTVVCESVGLPPAVARRLILSLTRVFDVSVVDDHTGSLRASRAEVMDFVSWSLSLLQSEVWNQSQVRQWAGKAIFMATFDRPLLSILEEMFPLAVTGIRGGLAPSAKKNEEMICFLVLSLQAGRPLKFSLSDEISCTQVSPMGGSCATAVSFLDRSLEVAPAEDAEDSCTACGSELKLDRAIFPCPWACGKRGCSIACAQSHFEQGECPRRSFGVPRFGERFAGANFPLTKSVALAGGAVQRPLDILIKDNSWDYFSEPGKAALEYLEKDPALRWRHWAPDSFTFVKSKSRPDTRKGKGKKKGPVRIRSEEQPWGVDGLSRLGTTR